MKIFKLMAVALVAMVALNSCSEDCDHNFIEHDYTNELVGTWTCMEEDFAQALTFKADGSVITTGVHGGEYWEDAEASWKLENNKLTLSHAEDVTEFALEIIPGQTMSVVDVETGERNIFEYCANDLADEVVGMWVCNDGLAEEENDMVIMSYSTEGKVTMTTPASTFVPTDFVNQVFDYKVVGDLLFKMFPKENFPEGANPYLVSRLTYSPNGTSLGDILIENQHTPTENGVMELTFSFLRVKQNLDLAGKKYDYTKTFVTNAKGADKDIAFLDTKFNFAHMDGSIIDKFLKSVLYNVQFPDAKTFQYNCLLEGQNVSLQLPMEVEGNKITIKMSSRHEAYRDVVVYAYQDVDGCQFHMYMPTASFENFFSNLSLSILSASGQVDINNPVHVDAVYKEVADALESINLSIVMKAN